MHRPIQLSALLVPWMLSIACVEPPPASSVQTGLEDMMRAPDSSAALDMTRDLPDTPDLVADMNTPRDMTELPDLSDADAPADMPVDADTSEDMAPDMTPESNCIRYRGDEEWFTLSPINPEAMAPFTITFHDQNINLDEPYVDVAFSTSTGGTNPQQIRKDGIPSSSADNTQTWSASFTLDTPGTYRMYFLGKFDSAMYGDCQFTIP